MEVAALRTWGLAASAAALASALTIAALGGCEQPTATSVAPTTSVAVAPATPVPEPALATGAEPVAEPATTETPPAKLTATPARVTPTLLVRFEAPHPLARVQEIAAQGRVAEASRAAQATIRGRGDLRGLCFDRFTLGGTEIVLKACSAVADGQAFQRRWSTRLNAMPGVDYAEPNAIAHPDRRAKQ